MRAHQAFLWSRYCKFLLDSFARSKFCSRVLNEFSQDVPPDPLGSFAGGCLRRSIPDEVRHMSDIVSRSHESFGCSILKCKAVVHRLGRPYFSCEQPSRIDNRVMGNNGGVGFEKSPGLVGHNFSMQSPVVPIRVIHRETSL